MKKMLEEIDFYVLNIKMDIKTYIALSINLLMAIRQEDINKNDSLYYLQRLLSAEVIPESDEEKIDYDIVKNILRNKIKELENKVGLSY